MKKALITISFFMMPLAFSQGQGFISSAVNIFSNVIKAITKTNSYIQLVRRSIEIPGMITRYGDEINGMIHSINKLQNVVKKSNISSNDKTAILNVLDAELSGLSTLLTNIQTVLQSFLSEMTPSSIANNALGNVTQKTDPVEKMNKIMDRLDAFNEKNFSLLSKITSLNKNLVELTDLMIARRALQTINKPFLE